MSQIESFDNSYTIVLNGTAHGGGRRVLKTGDLIGGSYKLKSLLGQGGMGYVFCAEHTIIKRDYALKMLAPERLTEASLRRFEIETKAIANLDHPNIVKVYNMGLDAGEYPFYVMDLLDGTALSERISAGQDLTFKECLDILGQIAAGLGYAHSKGIVHRDVKPSNIILLAESNGRVSVKIVDFGIAKLLPSANLRSQSQTATGEVFGSPYYMSPEQCMGSQVDHRSDIYSLGCTFFEALCGQPPYCGANAMETVLMHQNNPIPSILEMRPEKHCPQAVDLLLSKMMAKVVEERYQSMEQLMHDLERVKQGKAIGKVAPNSSFSHNNPYPVPDRSRGRTSVSELPEDNFNDRGHHGNRRMALMWIPGLLLLVVGVTYYAWNYTPLLKQIAGVKQQAFQNPGDVSGLTKSSSQVLHNGLDQSGVRADHVVKAQDEPVAPSPAQVPGFDSMLSQKPGEDDYRQAMSAEVLRKQLAHPSPNNYFELNNYRLTDELFTLIAATSWIHNLSLDRCNITNESLARLAKLHLKQINLNNSTFDDIGALRLTACQELQNIQASSTYISDKGVSYLSTIKGLKQLSLAGTPITDQGLSELKNAKALIDLNLIGANKITNRGLSALVHTNLHGLSLEDTSVGDAGIIHISKIADLSSVNLNRTNVTIKGLKELCTLRSKLGKPELTIFIKGCPNLRQNEIRELRAAYPAVQFIDNAKG